MTALAVVALLACINWPFAGTSRHVAWSSQCFDNFGRLTLAWQIYAMDYDGWFPPNTDDGSATPGRAWVGGVAGPGGAQEYNPDMITNPRTSLLVPYLDNPALIFRCPADQRQGIYRGADPALRGTRVPAVRAVAMNVAVGTDPASTLGRAPTQGFWLDSNHAHTFGRKWRTYGRESQLTVPGPNLTSVMIEEDELSINDALLAFGMERAEWLDWPATRHDLAGAVSFADGHVEMHSWSDPRTRVDRSVVRLAVPNSPDYAWLRDRTSALLPGR